MTSCSGPLVAVVVSRLSAFNEGETLVELGSWEALPEQVRGKIWSPPVNRTSAK